MEELDEDLLAELDDIVQQNQHAFHPFARSGRSEAELLERHPGLLDKIDSARQRRIDSMRLHSRFNADEEDRPTSTGKLKVGSWDGSASSPSTPVPESSPRITPRPSPAMAPHDAGQDLLFEMEEDHSLIQLAGEDEARPSLQPHGSTAEHLEQTHPLAQPSAPIALRSFSADAGTKPWTQPEHALSKVNFKDIMLEANASASSLTLATPNLSVPIGSPTSYKAPARVSQKERKKMQKEQLQSKLSEDHGRLPANAPPTPQAAPTTSPWNRIEPRRTSNVQVDPSILGTRRAPASSREQPPSRKSSGTVTSVKPREPIQISQAKPEEVKQTRSSSYPILSLSTEPLTPTIQSIRHAPMPASSRPSVDSRTSMAEILSQQQTEKVAIKEAVAKKSLQEIQQEQEFQEWWDAESRRVQEEAQGSAADGRKSRRVRGRGDGRRSRGRARSSATPNETGRTSGTNHAPVSLAQGHGRGRGQ